MTRALRHDETTPNVNLGGTVPSLSVLVLNYNGLEELLECIQSMRFTDYQNFNLTVIDNGSTDGSVDYVRKAFPWVNIIEFDKNYGFGKAYNKAMSLVVSKYILLLNNDITASAPDWLSRMVLLAESSSDIGAVGPKLVMKNNPDRLDAVGGMVFRWMGCSPLGHGELDRGQYDHPPADVFYMGGGALLMSRELYNRLGGFDSNIFAYAEDLDLCWRLRLAGYRIAYCPEVVLLHKGSSLWRRSTSTKLRLSQQNFLYCCIKNYSRFSLLREVPILMLLNLWGSLGTSLIDRRADVFLAVLKSLTSNLLGLRKTLIARARTQRGRVVNEHSILAAMGRQRLMRISQIMTTRLNFTHESANPSIHKGL
jgi:GT2 family glycosyltransferase